MKKILLVHRGEIHKRPPVQASLLNLHDLGYDLTLITSGINGYWSKELAERGIKFYQLKRPTGVFGKLLHILFYFNLKVKNIIEKINPDYLWIEGGDTLVYLNKGTVKKKEFILQIQELYDNWPIYKFRLKWFFKNSRLNFVPCQSRASIFKVWYDLKKNPIVLPNIPTYSSSQIPCVPQNDIDIVQEIIDKGSKIVLYIGILTADRDLTSLIKAIDTYDGRYKLLLVGAEYGNVVDGYLSLSSNVVYLGSYSSPNHLSVIQYAHMGCMLYDEDSLNNVFCAPNKIYEYAMFGKPMLMNRVPEISLSLEKFQAGAIVEDSSLVSDYIDAINIIDKSYSNFANGSIMFYNSVDRKQIIEKSFVSLS